MTKYQQYFKILRYSIQPDAKEIPDISGLEWQGLYSFSCKQSIAGVVFEGVKHLGEQGVKPPFRLLMEWLATAEQIKNRNKILYKRCVELTEMLRKDGFACCILKGQGNALSYPNHYSRTPGDIDILVLPKGYKRINERRKAITEYVKKIFPKTRIRYQHIDYNVFPDVEVEMHFIPTKNNVFFYNRRIQKWTETLIEEQFEHIVDLPNNKGQIVIPTSQFNVVYQMSHLINHFFDEGIGLRQFVDYYYVLQQIEDPLRLPLYKGRNLKETLKYLGLWKFAGAVMYVMREVFALEERYMITPVDERRGKTLLNEILKGGNFGQHSGLTNHSTGGKYFAKTWRNMKLVREYPAEALCEPVFRTWHFFWRLAHR